MSANERELSDKLIADKLYNLIRTGGYKRYLVYISTMIEVDTKRFIQMLFNNRVDVFAPRCVKGSNEMIFCEIKSFDDLERGEYNIFAPADKCEAITEFYKSDCCIIPAMSYDKRGFRVGFGKGYYDRFLSNFKGKKIGICYDNCICNSIPNDKFDIKADLVITQSREIKCK